MPVALPPLPYPPTALAPHISEQTFAFHHGKHHQAYVTNLNGLIAGSSLESASLEDVIRQTAGKADQLAIFNNAAQVWNHTFYWNSMKPQGGGKPAGELGALVETAFGGYDGFAEAFKAAAATQFGSGWAWLVFEDGGLKITKTANADTPLAHGQKALLTVDVWEHAYYLDYQNRRPDYVATFLSHLVNWDFVASNLALS